MKRLFAWWWVFAALSALAAPPSFDEVRSAWRPSEAYLLDRHGALLQQVRIDRQARRLAWTPLDSVSPALLRALLVAEDRRFYQHSGVDWRAVGAASWRRLTSGPPRGASTITMQVSALLDPDLAARRGHRSWRQKLKQMHAARDLEKTWSKRQILEAYLNLVGFRGELQGVAAAAWVLFGKVSSGLTEREALLLAAVLPSPNRDPDRLSRRACAIAAAGDFAVTCPSLRELGNVLNRPARMDLPDAAVSPLAARLLHRAGAAVTTTLDITMQRRVSQFLAQQLHGLMRRNVRDGAAVVVDNASGEILAYVGSAGPYSKARQVDGARAPRQAGSTLKPFLYALALERRYLTAASLLNDTPVHLETSSGLYIPQNYDRDFKGTVSVRTALAGSLNVPAVRTLALVGVQRFRDQLHDLGYLGITEAGEYYGFSLALGSAEVSLLEQVNAYRTLANAGLWSPLRLQPGDAAGPRRRVITEQTSFIVADILADRAGRAITFGLENPLTTRYWTAVKTGTSKDMRDNWCIGFSRRYTVGVWVGNFEGDSMHDVSGITGAGPVWREIMDELHAADPAFSRPPEPPAGLAISEVRFEPALEPPRAEWFLPGTEVASIRLTPPERRRPRIVSPPNGVVIALDPDVPAGNQAVIFLAQAAQPGARFHLDGLSLAPAHQRHKWTPVPGKHRLGLVGPDGKVFDAVDFTVRPPREQAN